MKYFHQELPRRRYDPKAKEILDRVIASLEGRHEVFTRRFISIEGNGPQAANAHVKWSAALDRIEKQLLFLHGVELPEADAERILDERALKMDQAADELLSEPVGYPEMSEQAIVDRHIEEEDRKLVERFGYNPLKPKSRPKPAPTKPEPTDEDETTMMGSGLGTGTKTSSLRQARMASLCELLIHRGFIGDWL